MLARLSAFVIWALVAATAVFWGLRLLVRSPSAPERTVVVGDTNLARGDLSRLLGSAPLPQGAAAPVADANARFKLLGIMAPRETAGATPHGGVALIAIDGKMPKAYVVGSSVDGDMMLQSVSLRTVSIGSGPGPAAITLELPPPVAAAIGRLPAGGATTAQAPVAPPQVAPPVAPVIVPAPMTPQVMSPQGQPPTSGGPQAPGSSMPARVEGQAPPPQ